MSWSGARLVGPYALHEGYVRSWATTTAAGEEFVAQCPRCATPPGDSCGCGLAFVASLEELVAIRPSPPIVVSQVIARGRIAPDPEHAGGYRAERLAMLRLVVPPALAAYADPMAVQYRVPVTVNGAGPDVLAGLLERATADGWPAVTREDVRASTS